MRMIFTTIMLLLGFMMLPANALAQTTVCQCQVVIEGVPNPAPPATCPVGTLTANASQSSGSGFVLDASNLTFSTPPASVTANPPTCVAPAAAVGTNQVTIPADQCNSSFSAQLDVTVLVNQLPQTFAGRVTNCQSRTLAGEQNFDIELTNPLPTDNPTELIAYAIRAGLGVIGSLTLVAFVAGGFMWVTSAGNADKVKQGLNTMLYAAIGIAVIFTAYAVLQFVLQSVGAA